MSITILNEFLKITVNDIGAELIEIKSVKTGNDYLHDGNPSWWKFHAPILFPIVGRNKDDLFKIDGKEYPINRHGFARNLSFVLEKLSDNVIRGTLSSDSITKKSFPYDFNLYVTYKLENNKIVTTFDIINSSEEKMFFGLGGHPAFKCPIKNGASFSDYYLEFSENETVKTATVNLENGYFTEEQADFLINENKVPLSYDLFSIDTIVLKNTKSNLVSLKSDMYKENIVFDYTDFPFIAFWTKKDAPFICIEPWYSHSDYESFDSEHSLKEGFIYLLPKETFNASYSVIINE